MRSEHLRSRNIILPIFALGLCLSPLIAGAATPAALQADQSPTMPAPNGGAAMGKGAGGKLAGFFTPQQRAMFMLQARDEVKDMTPDQKKAYRKQQIQKFLAMSDGDKQKMRADLQARWDALPPARQQRMSQRMAAGNSGAPPIAQ